MRISKRVDKLAPSGIRAFFDLVLGMKDVISLGVGEPDFVAAKLSSMANVRQTATHFLLRKYKEEGQVFKHPKNERRQNISY